MKKQLKIFEAKLENKLKLWNDKLDISSESEIESLPDSIFMASDESIRFPETLTYVS